MSDWSEGYVSDIGYTYGYYLELNPHRIPFALLNNRLATGEVVTACELGFGQGVSTNIHAAASSVEWYGTDFNPAHAAFAQELANVAESGAKLYDDAFADFCKRSDLPDFDFIALHGIWSWISDENRTVIVDFIRRKLKVGGVLYISYNTLPGWSAFVPMRHLLNEYVGYMGVEGQGIVSQIDGAIKFAEQMLAVNPAYSRANPQVAERFNRMKASNRHYLAHEYFNRDWHPMHFGTMASWLQPAKLDFACSAHYIDHIHAANFSGEQRAFLKEIPDPRFRETVRDFMVNQQFRRDYWIKGPRTLSTLQQLEALRGQRFVMVGNGQEFPMKINSAIGEAALSEAVYRPIINLLSDHKPRTVTEIEEAVSSEKLLLPQIIEVALVLTGAGLLAHAQEDILIDRAKLKTDRLNKHLMERARSNGEIGVLASPVIGGGMSVDRFSQLFLRELQAGKETSQALAEGVWKDISLQNQKITKSGKILETAEENVAELTEQASRFITNQLPRLRALGIA